MTDPDLCRNAVTPYPPGRALFMGMLWGFIIVLCGLLWVFYSGYSTPSGILWVMPLTGSAVASCVTALKKGSSISRSLSLAVFAFIAAFSLSMLADYFYILIMVTDLPLQETDMAMELLKVKLAVSLLAVILGAVLGLMLGKRPGRG